MPNHWKGGGARAAALSSLSNVALVSFLLATSLGMAFAIENDANNSVESSEGGKRRPVAIVHVGPRKTGSTAIQSSLSAYGTSLLEDNYVVPVPFADSILGCFDGDTGSKCDAVAWKEASDQIRNARQNSNNIIYSCEGLDNLSSEEQFEALSNLMDGFDIHIVAVYRKFYDWVASAYGQKYRVFDAWNSWNFRGKEGTNRVPLTNFVDWISKPPKRVDNLFRNHFSTAVYGRYVELGGYNVTLLNTYEGNGDVVENFFCNVLDPPQGSHSCEAKRTSNVEPNRSNRAESLEYDEIAMAAVGVGMLDETRISRLDARDAIRRYHEEDRGLTLEDFVRVCPPDEVLKQLFDLTIESEREYLPTYFVEEEGEEGEKLRSVFETNREVKFCSVDTESVLSDPSWVEFLEGLGAPPDDTERKF